MSAWPYPNPKARVVCECCLGSTRLATAQSAWFTHPVHGIWICADCYRSLTQPEES